MISNPSKNISVQFQNIAAGLNDGARFSTEGSWQFFVSQSPEEIYENSRTNIDHMINPILSNDSDIVSFSEVFGIQQRDHIQERLESMGYSVYSTDAFEMWSQSVEGEHLYNMVGIREDKLGKPKNTHYPFRNKRKVAGVAFAMNYLMPVLPYTPKNGNLKKMIHQTSTKVHDSMKHDDDSGGETSPIVEQAKAIYNRLANGILDGAISVLEFDDFTLATGHVHVFSDEVLKRLQEHISPNKPFILLGDMNVKKGKDILGKPPFNSPDWKSLIGEEMRTFGFRPGKSLGDYAAMFLSHFQPDVIIAKGVEPISIGVSQSLSDHNGINGRLQLQSISQSSPRKSLM